ncbi:hypothetical protein [Orlajensenia leifsoniae]|uniref:Uncharacterized protein n=1 Tax=Orlajensenia leifsoniae TaxID=2561933 RepID=A0A4Y9R5K2_9MICO|nr:hypothetical protein [Leifsonia flava]TFV99904.1 hypothetical protein E4M00_01490 [Leifsonia flava]
MAAVAAVLLVLSGCSVNGSGEGPLEYEGPEHNAVCVPAVPGTSMVVGETIVAPDGFEATVIDVTLVDARNLKLTEASIAPIINQSAIGTSAYPPTEEAWTLRRDAAGATLPEDTTSNLLVVLERTGDMSGTASSVQIRYTVGGTAYVEHGTTSIELAEACD